MPSRPLIIVDITAPGRDGILQKFGSATPAVQRTFTQNDGNTFNFQFVERTDNDLVPYRIADLSNYTIQSAIGPTNDPPESGTFELAANSDSTGLTGLAYDIAEGALDTALNANPEVVLVGGVTVRKYGFNYEIRLDDVTETITFAADGAGLVPECYASVLRTQTVAQGGEVWWLKLKQKPLAYTNDFFPGTVGDADVEVLQAGDSSKAEVQRISLDLPSYAGSIIVNVATRQEGKITCVADVAASLHQKGVILEDANGTVGFWMDVSGGGTAPAEILACTRNTEITTVTSGMSATNVAIQWQSAIDADAQFTATRVGNVVTWRAAEAGRRIDATDVGTGFGLETTQDGVVATAAINADASATEMAGALGDVVNVSRTPGLFQWDVTFKGPGAQDLITVDASALFQTVYTATLDLGTQQTERRFAITDEDTISDFWEISLTPDGGKAITVYQVEHVITRDVISDDASSSITQGVGLNQQTGLNILNNIDGYVGGGPTILDGIPTSSIPVPYWVMFYHTTDGGRIYRLVSGNDATDSPAIIRPTDYADTTNEKVWKSVLYSPLPCSLPRSLMDNSRRSKRTPLPMRSCPASSSILARPSTSPETAGSVLPDR